MCARQSLVVRYSSHLGLVGKGAELIRLFVEHVWRLKQAGVCRAFFMVTETCRSR